MNLEQMVYLLQDVSMNKVVKYTGVSLATLKSIRSYNRKRKYNKPTLKKVEDYFINRATIVAELAD